MEKKQYFIKILGESCGWCVRDLTDSEYELIKGIFEECDSEYVGGSIKEIHSQEEYEKMIYGYAL